MSTPHQGPGIQAIGDVAAGRRQVGDIVADHMSRIDHRDPLIHAWVTLADDPQPAVKHGPLSGMTVGVKDVIDTAALPTQCNSPLFEGYRPDQDAACVTALTRAGATVLGKTVTTEFAFFHPGPTRNPWNLGHTPGGSSSGSAAAVADRQAHVALATQTGGSSIRPAAFCGVFGYKPAFGRIPTAGLHLLAPSLDTIGLHAAALDDLAVAAAILEDRPLSAVAQPPTAILIAEPPHWHEAEPAQRDAIARAESALANTGVTVSRLVLPPAFERASAAHRPIMATQMARTLAGPWGDEARRGQLSQILRDFIEFGRGITDQGLAEAWAHVAEAEAELQSLAPPGSILVLPPCPGEAPAGLASTGNAAFNRLWTMLGRACLTMPIGFGPHGLPLGIQIVDPDPRGDRILNKAAWCLAPLGIDWQAPIPPDSPPGGMEE